MAGVSSAGPDGPDPRSAKDAFAVGDEQVAVFRPRSGGLHALQAICPHRGGPLADGPIDGQHVICLLHNHAFRLADGHRTTGERSVQAYQVAVEDGEVVLRL